MHSRIIAVIVSIMYLFGPILFEIPKVTKQPPASFAIETKDLGDTVSGKGGPIIPLIFTQKPLMKRDSLVLADPEIMFFDSVSVVGEFGPKITITKIYNHMKVANTVMPVIDSTVSSGYGWRTPPCSRCSSDHKGVDFVPGYGTPVFAVADGMVVHMGYGGEFGYYIVLKHLIANHEGIIEEWETLYAHLKKDSFTEGLIIGSAVRSGETIAAVGNTGLSTGPHLHFELKINGEHVDPLPFLGTFEVFIVTEEEYPDYMFVGQTFKVVRTETTYE